MKTKDKKSICTFLAVAFSVMLAISPYSVSAAEFTNLGTTDVKGKLYEFPGNSHYDIQTADTATETNSGNTCGSFQIMGNIIDSEPNADLPSYKLSEGNLSFYYHCSDEMLGADEESWHVIDDMSKEAVDVKLDSDILKGAIIIQTSKDRKTWLTMDSICNAFGNNSVLSRPIYETTDIQILNGCYYRVIVAYKLSMLTETGSIGFLNTDKYDYKKCAEVYEFYACSENSVDDSVDLKQSYNLGSKVRADQFDGYFGESAIGKNDKHYGWDLGNFFVSGYTDEVSDAHGNMVFLKNVGDKVTLWFRLNQNINGLNGNDDLEITADTAGYDQYFETPKMDFGRGALIIRYTDHNNVKSDPVIYTNYLEANASVGADTRVQLFEEGDYEIALDYEVTSDELIDKVGHYRIFFRFSVRNGNCMVYPFDVETGNELTQSSMTENGFRLDLAQSRYLKINLKRETLTDSADGLVEDTRFNGPARDGAEYTDEGIYTITVSNEYTGQFTTKKIYVGTNNILRAHMTTGLSIPDINHLVEEGATIFEDGTIQLAAVTPTETEPSQIDIPETEVAVVTTGSDGADSPEAQGQKTGHTPIFLVLIVIGAVLLVASVLLLHKKKKAVPEITDGEDYEGGTEQ